MKIALIIVSVCAAALAGTTYYFYHSGAKIQDKFQDQTFKVQKLNEEKAALSQELEAKIADISQEKEEEISELKNTHDEFVADLKKEIEEGQIKITQLADRLSVSMVDKILFPSGKSNITSDGLEVLERVGNVLKNTQNKIIRVEGHTDNVPITRRLKKQFPTNWELSTARAVNVVRFLQEQVGIDAQRLQIIGMSEYHPIASNETPEGRSQNRRIEIALLPEGTGGLPVRSE